MKGAYLVAEDAAFADAVWRVLGDLGADVWEDGGQVSDRDGLVLMVEGGLDEAIAWDWREGPFEFRGTGPRPDMARTWALTVECRSEDAFATWMARLAERLPVPVWVLDGGGTVWPAAEVDPRAVRL